MTAAGVRTRIRGAIHYAAIGFDMSTMPTPSATSPSTRPAR